MLLFALLVSLSVAPVRPWDIGRLRGLPSISSSLVNLGKIDISFYINGKPKDFANKLKQETRMPFLKTCPCSELNYVQDYSAQKHPFELLDRILNSNNLFSPPEPTMSHQCCNSHELVQEDFLFEFLPKKYQKASNPLPSIFPIPSDFLMNIPNTPKLAMPAKNKAIEIFLFPKRKDVVANEKKITADIEVIKKVGGKDIKNDFKTEDLAPPVPLVTNNLDDQKKELITKKEDTKSDTIHM